MEINENLTKLIFQEFDDSIRGTDIYNHDGSMWLIFTEERKWVVEFTKQKTLWYNYKHFNDILILFGMELSEGAEYIKKWYEVKFISEDIIENTIQNGVEDVKESVFSGFVGDAIKNGVKNTQLRMFLWREVVEDTIQNGVKQIDYSILGSVYQKDHSVTTFDFTSKIENTIKSGVKEISPVDCDYNRTTTNVIKNGVKHMMSGSEFKNNQLEDIIRYSVKL